MNAETPITEAASICSNLSAAKIAVMRKIKRLEKLHENKHGGYAFASVDDFKDEIRPLLVEAGIDLFVSEEGFDIIPLSNGKEGKDAKTTLTAKIRFKFVLQHISGERSEPSYTTVCMPYTGAQTSGAAQSYAIKECVYKGLLQASSGDLNEEADIQEQVNLSEVSRLSKADAKPLYEALQKEMREIETETRDSVALADWWKNNIEQIRMLPIDWFHTLKKECADTGMKLKANEAADAKGQQ